MVFLTENKLFKILQLRIPFLFLLIIIFQNLDLVAGILKKPQWQQVYSPVYSDLNCIKFFGPDKGIIGCTKILICRNDSLMKMEGVSPFVVEKAFAIDSSTFYITTNSEYQESRLFFVHNTKWEEVYNPLINDIYNMYFLDKDHGVLTGYGEVARLDNGHWHRIAYTINSIINGVLMDDDSVIWISTVSDGIFKYMDNHWVPIHNSQLSKRIKIFNGVIYVLGNDFFGVMKEDSLIKRCKANKEFFQYNDFFVLDSTDITLVGNNGLITRIIKDSVINYRPVTNENLNAVWMIDKNNGWAVGNNGIVLHYTSKKVVHKNNYWKGFRKYTLNNTAKVVDDEYGTVSADFNNDGFVDIFTCGLFESNHLYINKKGIAFYNMAQQWRVTGEKSDEKHELNLGACAGDFNNDGYIDLYVTTLNGKNKLYKNFRAEYFIDYSGVAGGVGLKTDRSNSVITGDVDRDGDLDIFFTNETSTNRLYLNNGAGIFSEHTERVGLKSEYGGMGCSFGDIDNDGDLDLIVVNWSHCNVLYKNMLVETGKLFFKDITEKAGVAGENYSKSNGVVFADIDNDGDLDLYVSNRKTTNRIYLNNGKGVFKERTKELTGVDFYRSYGVVIADFDGDGYKDIYISNVGDNVLLMNDKAQKFVDKTEDYGANIAGYSTGSVAADLNNDGTIELYISNFIGESSTFLQNLHIPSNYIKIDLKCFKNNRDGIGTKIFVYKPGGILQKDSLLYYTEVSGGSGYASMSQFVLPVSILNLDSSDIRVVFPDGEEKLLTGIVKNSRIVVEDVSGVTKIYYLVKGKLERTFLDPIELLKFLRITFVLLFLFFAMKHGYKKYGWQIRNIALFSGLLLLLFTLQSINFENKNMFLYFTLPVLSVVIIYVIVNLFFDKQFVEAQAREEQDMIREKLSRDLHDDLASTISTIAIYLTLIKYNIKESDKKISELLDKTMSLASDASAVITDMIWAIKPKPESLNNLLIRINNNFAPLFNEKGILFKTDYRLDTDQMIFDAKVKRNIYLIIKESLNNTLKYASASSIKIMVKQDKQNIIIAITDDGVGFDYEKSIAKGHGLGNLKARAMEINGELEVITAPGKGTTVKMIYGFKK
jgi:signal transduction histidine kinase